MFLNWIIQRSKYKTEVISTLRRTNDETKNKSNIRQASFFMNVYI